MKFKLPVFAALIALMSFFSSQADAQVSATIRIGQPNRAYGRQYRPVRRPYVAPRPVVVYQRPVYRHMRPRRYNARPVQQVVIIKQAPSRGYGYNYGYRR